MSGGDVTTCMASGLPVTPGTRALAYPLVPDVRRDWWGTVAFPMRGAWDGAGWIMAVDRSAQADATVAELRRRAQRSKDFAPPDVSLRSIGALVAAGGLVVTDARGRAVSLRLAWVREDVHAAMLADLADPEAFREDAAAAVAAARAAGPVTEAGWADLAAAFPRLAPRHDLLRLVGVTGTVTDDLVALGLAEAVAFDAALRAVGRILAPSPPRDGPPDWEALRRHHLIVGAVLAAATVEEAPGARTDGLPPAHHVASGRPGQWTSGLAVLDAGDLVRILRHRHGVGESTRDFDDETAMACRLAGAVLAGLPHVGPDQADFLLTSVVDDLLRFDDDDAMLTDFVVRERVEARAMAMVRGFGPTRETVAGS